MKYIITFKNTISRHNKFIPERLHVDMNNDYFISVALS